VTIYTLGPHRAEISPDAYIHPAATIIGQVIIGPGSSVWPGAVLRGDAGPIVIGSGSNIQDGAVIHTTVEWPTRVGDHCVIGHLAHLEGCVLEDECLVGSNAVVLHGASVGSGALVGASALVPNRMVVPPATMALGVPARIVERAPAPGSILANARHYVERAAQYRAELRVDERYA
jgi:carbonic anhydrase/acetyltransferase-like protein (isoleucine patch superfamily)